MSFQVPLILMYIRSKQRSSEGHSNAPLFFVVLHTLTILSHFYNPKKGKLKTIE